MDGEIKFHFWDTLFSGAFAVSFREGNGKKPIRKKQELKFELDFGKKHQVVGLIAAPPGKTKRNLPFEAVIGCSTLGSDNPKKTSRFDLMREVYAMIP